MTAQRTGKIVEICGGSAGAEGAYLSKVFDKKTGEFYLPVPGNEAFQQSVEANHQAGFTGSGVSMVILDTGVMSSHPYIKERLVDSADFTGTGVEDENGHGTMVALLAIWASPGVSIYSGKILDAAGCGTEQSIIKGIEWAVSLSPKIINISAGINNKKWGLFTCNGSCDVCKAAEFAAAQGILVLAAAGNSANMTLCPATSGAHGGSVLAVEACDMDLLHKADYSGDGNISAPAGSYVLRKLA